jgi:RNA polymerase sigma-70 factor (ECF subfamily)
MKDHRRQREFDTLLQQHRGIVFKVASVYARGREDRADLAQEIAVQLWRSFGSFDERRAKFSTWMYRVSLNVAISHARQQARDERLEPLDATHLELPGDPDVTQPDERLAALYAFIGQLDPLNRALIVLYLDERSYAEIAQVMGISETNVATRIGRIKQKLRGRMTAAASTGA